MSIPYTSLVNERVTSQLISNESHVIGIVGVATVAPTYIRLIEVPQAPNPFSTVSITGAHGPYNEITSGTPTGGQFLVDYTTGVITFDIAQDGNTVLVTYYGLGSEFAAEDVNELHAPVGVALNYDGSLSSGIVTTVSLSGALVVPRTSIQPMNMAIVPVTNGSGYLISSSTTVTQLSYLDATSSIQTQLNSKQPTLTEGNLTETVSSILTITGGTDAVIGTGTTIQVSQAGSSTNGYLSATDWNTFNNKQPAGNYITALTGDVTASGPGPASATLATVNSSPNTYNYATLTVNAKGLVTSASSSTPVTSIYADSNPLLMGSVQLVSGTNVTLSQTGQAITINSTGGGTPAGSDTQIQYNNAGAFGASPSLTFNNTTKILTVLGSATAPANLYLDSTVQGAQITFADDVGSTVFGGISCLATGELDITSSLATGFIQLETFDGTNSFNWIFGADGVLTTPTSAPSGTGIILSSNGTDQGYIEFDDSGSNSVSIAAPTTVTATYDLYLPTAQGAASTFLSNDGSGNLSWLPASGAPLANVALTNQGADISSTPLFTASTTGLYSINVYVVPTVSDAGAGSSVNINLAWTDDFGGQTTQITTFDLKSAGIFNTGVEPIEITSGSVLSYSVTGGGTYGAAVYSLYIVVRPA